MKIPFEVFTGATGCAASSSALEPLARNATMTRTPRARQTVGDSPQDRLRPHPSRLAEGEPGARCRVLRERSCEAFVSLDADARMTSPDDDRTCRLTLKRVPPAASSRASKVRKAWRARWSRVLTAWGRTPRRTDVPSVSISSISRRTSTMRNWSGRRPMHSRTRAQSSARSSLDSQSSNE